MKQTEFFVRDMYLGAFLYARGMKLIRVDRDDGICWFIFENKGLCEELQRGFFSRVNDVNAKGYADALKTLKNLVFMDQQT